MTPTTESTSIPREPQLLQNAVFVPEDDLYVVSTHQHDYVEHTFKDGLTIAVDGGLAYLRRAGDFIPLDRDNRYEEYCLNDAEPFEGWITERLLWGHRGKDGTQPLTYRPIKELAYAPDGVNHMKAILANCLNINPMHKRVVQFWLARREEEMTQ